MHSTVSAALRNVPERSTAYRMARSAGRFLSKGRSETGRASGPSDVTQQDEHGAILILALIYILTISLIVVALSTWATNDLNNSTKFSNARFVSYSATNATELAIENIRYTPLVGQNQTLVPNPPGYCWGTSGRSTLTTNKISITVWCSTVQNLQSGNTRTVTFSACLSTVVSGVTCAANPLLQAIVIYDDYPKSGGTPRTTSCSLYCGTYATLQNWNWGSTASAASGLNANSITITSTPTNPTAFGTSYTPSATAASLDTVSIVSATPLVCTMSSSGVVSFVKGGSCTLNFDDSGNSFFSPAAEVQQTFSVALAANSITIASSAPSNAVVGGSYIPSATATSSDPVSIGSTTQGVCTMSAGTVNYVAPGTCTLTFDDSGNSIYGPAPQKQQSFNVIAIVNG